MQKVLLNVNTATSAFFSPITVAEFLKDNTFLEDERERILKTLRVYIVPNRQADLANQEQVDHLNKPMNRIKTFFAQGPPLKDKSMTFPKTYRNSQGQLAQEQKRTHVVDHMKEVFGKPFNSTLKAINVGTAADPVYYPGEYLEIMPYQIYKRLLPGHLVESMLKQAANLPTQSRRLVEIEGMKSLGLDPARIETDEQEMVSRTSIITGTRTLTFVM
jgi:eukaryotic translation initiation factor 2C